MGGFYKLSEWVMKFTYLNILWILFTFLGVILFGFFPATVAMFAVIRMWLKNDIDKPIFKTFVSYYKKEFIKGNLLGLLLIAIGLLMYVNINFLRFSESVFTHFLIWPNLLLSLIFILTLIYIFPVYVHFDSNVFILLKNAFIVMITHPLSTLIMVVLFIAYSYLVITLPVLVPIISGSLLAFLTMGISYRTFMKSSKAAADG